jgi:hypothetical protein
MGRDDGQIHGSVFFRRYNDKNSNVVSVFPNPVRKAPTRIYKDLLLGFDERQGLPMTQEMGSLKTN